MRYGMQFADLARSQSCDGHPSLLMPALLPALLNQPKAPTLLWKKKQQLHFLRYLCHSHFQSKRYCSLLLSKLISALLRENNLDSLPSSESQTVIATFSGGTGIIKSLRKDRVFLFVMKSKKEMKQVSLLVCRHGHQILIFKLSTYDVKSIKLLGQLSCNSKDTIFTVPLEENSAFILFLSLKHLIIILFYAY